MIKRTPADDAFSKCIRALANYCCEVCGTGYTDKDVGLHCSHFHGRANWSVRFDPDNAESACYGCHAKLEGSPHDFTRRWEAKLGEFKYELLLERKRDIGLGKMYRQTKGKGDIAKHFREQLELIKNGQLYIEPFL